jgi:hypothetical protein
MFWGGGRKGALSSDFKLFTYWGGLESTRICVRGIENKKDF